MTTPTATPAEASTPRRRITVTTIKPTVLMVDHSVQRPQDNARIANIAGDFDPDSMGVIHVSKRDTGEHHIMDGQHRIGAAMVLGKGDTPVDCKLYEGLSRPEEAAMFRRLNNTRGVQTLDRFLIRIVEGEPVACTLETILHRHGWRIAKQAARGAFFAVSALETVYKAKDDGDVETCETVIRIATEAWGHDSNALRAQIVSGLGALLRRYPGLDMPKLITEMAKHDGGPLGLIGRAKQLRDIRGGRIADSMAEILVNLHNKRRSTGRLPEWGTA